MSVPCRPVSIMFGRMCRRQALLLLWCRLRIVLTWSRPSMRLFRGMVFVVRFACVFRIAMGALSVRSLCSMLCIRLLSAGNETALVRLMACDLLCMHLPSLGLSGPTSATCRILL